MSWLLEIVEVANVRTSDGKCMSLRVINACTVKDFVRNITIAPNIERPSFNVTPFDDRWRRMLEAEVKCGALGLKRVDSVPQALMIPKT